MKRKLIKLTESDLERVVNRVIKEHNFGGSATYSDVGSGFAQQQGESDRLKTFNKRQKEMMEQEMSMPGMGDDDFDWNEFLEKMKDKAASYFQQLTDVELEDFLEEQEKLLSAEDFNILVDKIREMRGEDEAMEPIEGIDLDTLSPEDKDEYLQAMNMNEDTLPWADGLPGMGKISKLKEILVDSGDLTDEQIKRFMVGIGNIAYNKLGMLWTAIESGDEDKIKAEINELIAILWTQEGMVEDPNDAPHINESFKTKRTIQLESKGFNFNSPKKESKRKLLENKGFNFNKQTITEAGDPYVAPKLDDASALKVARKLHDSMKGLGTDENAFWKITDKYAECCSAKIREAFKQAYGNKGDLRKWIEGDFTKEQPWWNAGVRNDPKGKGAESALKAWGYVN